MDVSSQMERPKKQKLGGGEEMVGQRKGLSDLPDVVIAKIISSLPTKEAIRTSILSKRWEYLWTSIPNLEFYPGNAKRSLLVNVVDRALLLRGPSDIKRFRLRFPVLGDASRVHAWISAIVRRNVEDLSIELDSHKEPFSLPHSLLTSATLKVLNLYLPCSFKVPSTICFSSLRELSLCSVVFSDDYSTQQLFSGCPVLEKLSFSECNWENIKFVSICAPKLLSLSIDESELPISRGSNVCQIMVFGASLAYFYYSGQLLNDYCLCNSSVHEAHISIDDTKGSRLDSYLLHKLLRGLSTVKSLTIFHQNFEVALTGASELLAQMPMFNDLTTLIFDGSVIELDSMVLLRILQNCPCLRDLSFHEGVRLCSDDAKDDGMLDIPLPPCFSTSLKEIAVTEFCGNQNELRALRILLKNAIVLENMFVSYRGTLEGNTEKKRDLNKQISDLPKGSQSCEIDCD
ncbi:putative F-box domain, FBD domain, leucine-rich repeat domain, L domain-containing protein [Rosa chinensis]|uniref:Putative F-box domain, FBD domain, leucine-rich repeat domain, L domain-containing protein n=1 Tax=Rosa chinensis TaxID=74649 RepID=A0A2P6QK20_ROSCH|nr:F-box/LRR-repeat protein At3g26922 [Rosa chinensis]PRQ34516.1 putative F-box domain, FBD domain, leucine-rich repeat domain, L domain-containing protein [Rosa chinensis]